MSSTFLRCVRGKAALTSTSIFPNRSMAVAASCCTCEGSVTSAGTASAPEEAAIDSSVSLVRAAMITRAPLLCHQ